MLKALKEESVSKKRKRKDRKWIRKMNWQYISFYYPSINASSLPLNAFIFSLSPILRIFHATKQQKDRWKIV